MIEIGLLVLGIVAHWGKKLMEIHQETGRLMTPAEYFRAQPYRVIWTTLLAVGAGIALYSMGELTPVTAIVYGFACDSVAGMLKRRVP